MGLPLRTYRRVVFSASTFIFQNTMERHITGKSCAFSLNWDENVNKHLPMQTKKNTITI
jgi:hypothetical protein